MRIRMKLALQFGVALILGFCAKAAFADVPASDQNASPLTPEKIYLRSVRAMDDAPQPAFVTFREDVDGRNFTLRCTSDGISVSSHHGDVRASYDVAFRTSDGSAVSQPIGVANAKPCPATLLAPVGDDLFSVVAPQASPSPSAATTAAAQDSPMGPSIIGAVHAYSPRYYHVTLAGLEQLGGHDVYHLKLTAYRDPATHPLTDLYVDPKTFLMREARGEVSGHYLVASGRVAGVIDFDRVGAYWLVEHEHFEIAANAVFVHTRMTVSVDGSNFATPSELPNIVFPKPASIASPKPTPPPARTGP